MYIQHKLNHLIYLSQLKEIFKGESFNFNISVLESKELTFKYKKKNTFIVQELVIPSNATIKKCLFDSVKLMRNTVKCKFIYNGSGIDFDRARSWSFSN